MPTALPKYDVFLNFRGLDTRRNFISFLYKELLRRSIRTFKDDNELKIGQRISPELLQAIQESKFAVVVISVNYPDSPWCLDELVQIMDFFNRGSLTVLPIFYGVDPCHIRRQTKQVAQQFEKHEARENPEKVLLWRQALTALASISGDCTSKRYCTSKWEDDSKLVDGICDRISKELMIPTRSSNGTDLVGIDAHMKAITRLLDLKSKKDVKVIGIWARGGNGRSALAKLVYHNICQRFERHCFLESVKNISQDRHMSHLREECLRRINSTKPRLKDQQILLVANEVNSVEQIDALAEDFDDFGPGSVVIITTHNKQLLKASNIKLVYEVEHPRFHKVRALFRQLAFNERNVSAALENFAREWLGCLCGNSGYRKLYS